VEVRLRPFGNALVQLLGQAQKDDPLAKIAKP